MITLKQLEAFYWIGKLETFERAAKKLNTTQSAISKRIQELEQVIGLPLFDRSHRTAHVTEKGEQMLALAEQMLALRQRAINLSRREEPPARKLRLGITELTALTWLPSLVRTLRNRYPQLVIETRVDLGRDLYDQILEDRLDLVIVPDTFSDPHLTSVPLARSRNAWMGSPKLVRSDRILSVPELMDYTILMQGSRSGSGLWVSRWLKSQAVIVPRHFSSDSLTALLGMTVAGLGVTYLPLDCFEPLIKEGKLAVIPTAPELPEIPYVAMYPRDQLTTFIGSVAEIAQACCDFSHQLQ